MGAAGVCLAPPRLAADLARDEGGRLDPGTEARVIRRIAPSWADIDEGCLVPVLRPQAIAEALGKGALLLVAEALSARLSPGDRWVHPHAPYALAGLLAAGLEEAPDERAAAFIDPSARLGPGVRVGAFAVVRAGVVVGEGTVIEPHAVLYPGVVVGARVIIGAGAVIGRPGFGWAEGPGGEVRRVPQRGGVVIGDDAEIGPNATVDAGTLGPTRVGRGVKLDAQVHVGHNVELGAGTIVAAQSGFAGSVRVGEGARVGGQAGFADHVRVGERARVAAKAGVIGDVPPRAVVAGYPAMDRVRWLRGLARVFRR